MSKVDVAIVGGGIVGLATAYTLLSNHPGLRVTLLEKEPHLASHQTGHCSGVIHSGIYYAPGSAKARNCLTGKHLMEQFCTQHEIPWRQCGKVIVAVSDDERPKLQAIFKRGQANGIPCRLIGASQLRELEPAASGIEAIAVPGTGIVDYSVVSHTLAELIRNLGGTILVNAEVLSRRGPVLQSRSGDIEARLLVNCAGLYSDRLARRLGSTPNTQIIPFRGEYYLLSDEAAGLVRNLIYPVPDPNFPFLGVHLTRMIDNQVECGPNAVLALHRQGYRWRDISARDLAETIRFPGFLPFAKTHWRAGLLEMWRSVSKQAFLRALQRLVPALQMHHLIPTTAGVRAQAMEPSGKLVDDFLIIDEPGAVHVLNAPSPAATSSLSIGLHILERIEKQLGLR